MKHRSLVGIMSFVALALQGAAVRAQAINLSTGFMPDPQRFRGTAGGPVSAQTVQSDCRGYIAPQPSFILQTPTGFRFLRVFAEASADTTLMVRGVSQTWCADDVYGTNPGIDLRNIPPGRYDIYVGSYQAGQMVPYNLAVSELSSSVPAGGSNPSNIPPSVNPGAALGNLTPFVRPVGRPLAVRGNLRPVTAMGRTNGVFDASNIRGEGTCRGWMQGPPSHVMTLPTPMPFLSVFVTSAADSTLIIRRPDGSLVCNDDRYGLNPGIQGSFPAGIYQVWVGSYRQGEVRPYRITATINPALHP
jgi:hypothetical protein